MDSVGPGPEPENPGPGINNGQCGPRPRTQIKTLVMDSVGLDLEPLGSGSEPQNPGPDINN